MILFSFFFHKSTVNLHPIHTMQWLKSKSEGGGVKRNAGLTLRTSFKMKNSLKIYLHPIYVDLDTSPWQIQGCCSLSRYSQLSWIACLEWLNELVLHNAEFHLHLNKREELIYSYIPYAISKYPERLHKKYFFTASLSVYNTNHSSMLTPPQLNATTFNPSI